MRGWMHGWRGNRPAADASHRGWQGSTKRHQIVDHLPPRDGIRYAAKRHPRAGHHGGGPGQPAVKRRPIPADARGSQSPAVGIAFQRPGTTTRYTSERRTKQCPSRFDGMASAALGKRCRTGRLSLHLTQSGRRGHRRRSHGNQGDTQSEPHHGMTPDRRRRGEIGDGRGGPR